MSDTIDGQVAAEQVNLLTTQVTALNTEVQQLRGQLRIIAEMLLEEAQHRDFCGEYDDFVDNVNARIGSEVLLHRMREWLVTFTGTMNVEATSADRAKNACGEQLDNMEERCDWGVSMMTQDVELT
jgi:hypothetical protein